MENQVVSPSASNKTPEEIQNDMSQTREAISEKVAALENQVVGTVQNAADTLTDTVASVKSLISTAPGAVSDTVRQAATAVSESVKKTFDVTGHVRERPWTSVGVSAGLGFLAGWLISGGRSQPSAMAPVQTYIPPTTAPAAAPSSPGMFDELFAMLGRKVREVTETVIDSASNAVQQNVRNSVPKLVDAATEMAAARMSPEESPTNRLDRVSGFRS